MRDVMLDLETMGQGPEAAIVSIGAVEFDRERREVGDGVHILVDLRSSVQSGGVMDPDTVLWWLKQSDQARTHLNSGHPLHVAVALQQLTIFLKSCCELRDVRIWGNGSDFDNVILASAYRRLQLEVPWKFWNNRCYRTWKNEHPDARLERVGTHHNALDDAVSQARHMLSVPFEVAAAA